VEYVAGDVDDDGVGVAAVAHVGLDLGDVAGIGASRLDLLVAAPVGGFDFDEGAVGQLVIGVATVAGIKVGDEFAADGDSPPEEGEDGGAMGAEQVFDG